MDTSTLLAPAPSSAVKAPDALTMTLTATVSALLASGKGILAADESFPMIEKQFEALAIPSTEENRRSYSAAAEGAELGQ